MTGNKDKEIQNKLAHLSRLKATKARRSVEPILERASPSKDEKQTILIVCEGKNTEPSYFNQFRLTSAKIKAVGKGYNTVSLVEQATNLQEKEKCDQVWCVFDMDSNSPQSFNSAIDLATSKGYGVAYSNQSFEYWFILHFEDHQGGSLNRAEYNSKINRYINPMDAVYLGDSNKLVSEKFFNLLMGVNSVLRTNRTSLAISRAKRIYAQFNHYSPATEESSTTVFRLVEEILKYI